MLSVLGRGGMSAIYLAQQTSLGGRIVALKVLPQMLASASTRERFKREAFAIAQLKHPNIISAHDVVRTDQSFAYTMEYVSGGGVDQELKDEPEIRRTVHNAIERTYRAIGTPSKALAHIDEVKKITSAIEGEASIEYALALQEQALSLNDAGDWKASRDIGLQALKLLEARLPPGDIRLAPVCSVISGSHLSLGEMQAAEEYARRGYTIATSAANQAEIATTATLLVEVMERKGGKDTAAEVEEKCKLIIDISSKLHGLEHSKTLPCGSTLSPSSPVQPKAVAAGNALHQIVHFHRIQWPPAPIRV